MCERKGSTVTTWTKLRAGTEREEAMRFLHLMVCHSAEVWTKAISQIRSVMTPSECSKTLDDMLKTQIKTCSHRTLYLVATAGTYRHGSATFPPVSEKKTKKRQKKDKVSLKFKFSNWTWICPCESSQHVSTPQRSLYMHSSFYIFLYIFTTNFKQKIILQSNTD